MATHVYTKTWSNGGAALSESVSLTADSEINIEISLTSSQVDKEYDIDFAFARLKGIYIECDKDITIETNATDATGGDTIAVAGGEGFMWTDQDAFDNPFTANVTKFYITNGEASAATGKIRVLYDASV
jgi:hypothetical protein